jgi:hypothetical protein
VLLIRRKISHSLTQPTFQGVLPLRSNGCNREYNANIDVR